MRRAIVVPVLLALAALAMAADEPGEVVKSGFEGRLLLERAVAGHLKELNGRYVLRLSETTYAPGGYIGAHQHAGPGIRYVEEGRLAYVQQGRTTVYGPGDCFYETGDTTHTARNDGKTPVRLLNFELLPAGWRGSSAIPPPDSLAHR
ncbi:MAG TPA: cupin domain-containing protein [Candidatus Eisenbacteria bacterium]|nr:cupin domain-containing protein [Candidatus Eisenbacteria bacterium]